jgi:hypothetical protein
MDQGYPLNSFSGNGPWGVAADEHEGIVADNCLRWPDSDAEMLAVYASMPL